MFLGDSGRTGGSALQCRSGTDRDPHNSTSADETASGGSESGLVRDRVQVEEVQETHGANFGKYWWMGD